MMQELAEKMDWNKRVPVYYKHIHSLILNRKSEYIKNIPIDVDLIPRKLIILFLNRKNIPNKLVDNFLKEMEHYQLIELIDKQNIKIL